MRTGPSAEPVTRLRLPVFMVGQDRRGNWVVQQQNGCRGGLFVSRAEALRFVRFENGNRQPAYVAVGGVLELDMTGSRALAQGWHAGEAKDQRCVA